MQILMQAVLIIQCYRSDSERGDLDTNRGIHFLNKETAAMNEGLMGNAVEQCKIKRWKQKCGTESSYVKFIECLYFWQLKEFTFDSSCRFLFLGGDFYGGCHLEGNGAVRERQRTCPVILPCVKGQCHDVKPKAVHVKRVCCFPLLARIRGYTVITLHWMFQTSAKMYCNCHWLKSKACPNEYTRTKLMM